MKVTEKQLQIMLRILEGSILFNDRSDMNTFGYDRKTRERVYNDIINQQSDEIIDIKDKKK